MKNKIFLLFLFLFSLSIGYAENKTQNVKNYDTPYSTCGIFSSFSLSRTSENKSILFRCNVSDFLHKSYSNGNRDRFDGKQCNKEYLHTKEQLFSFKISRVRERKHFYWDVYHKRWVPNTSNGRNKGNYKRQFTYIEFDQFAQRVYYHKE